jgi:hypothetical protein
MRKVIHSIRDIWNVRAVIYLDDLLLLHQDKNYLEQIVGEISQYLSYLGWSVNTEKSHLVPSKQFEYLGFVWDSSERSIKIKDIRRQKALDLLRFFRKKCYTFARVSARSIAKLIGVLSSARTQFPNASLEYSKFHELKTNLVNSQGWESEIRLNYSYLSELNKWTKLFKENLPRKLPPTFNPHAIITTDASPSGWGATLNLLESRLPSDFSYSSSSLSNKPLSSRLPYSEIEF